MLTEVDDDDLGPVLQHNVMWRMIRDARDGSASPAATLGADTDAVLGRARATPTSEIDQTARTKEVDPVTRRRCSSAVAAGRRASSTSAGSYRVGMPQSPNHPPFWHTLPAPARRHGPRRRGQRRQRHDHAWAPTSAPTSTRSPTSPTTASCTAAPTPPRPGRAAGTPSSACTRSSRWSAAACSSTCPPPSASTCCEGGYEITVDDLEATVDAAGRRRSARATSCWSAAAGAGTSTTGPAYIGQRLRRPGRRRGRRPLAGRARRRTPPAPTPSPSSGSPPAAATRCCRRTGCCWSSTASTSSRRWTSRSWPPPASHEFTFVLVPLQHLRRHRLAGAAAGGGRA